MPIKTVVLSIVIYFSLVTRCYAYLDMGTGGYFLQIILAGFLASIFFIKAYWNRLTVLFLKLLKKFNLKRD